MSSVLRGVEIMRAALDRDEAVLADLILGYAPEDVACALAVLTHRLGVQGFGSEDGLRLQLDLIEFEEGARQ